MTRYNGRKRRRPSRPRAGSPTWLERVERHTRVIASISGHVRDTFRNLAMIVGMIFTGLAGLLSLHQLG
jgi:hypothetical protein